MARPRFHAVVSLPVAWGLRRRLGPVGAVSFAAMAILIDGDHLTDWVWMRLTRQRNRFLSPLHAWELLLLSAGVTWWLRADGMSRGYDPAWTAIARGVTFGWWFHMAHDMISNRPDHAGAYSLLNRIWHRFDRDRCGWRGHKSFHQWGGAPWWTWL